MFGKARRILIVALRIVRALKALPGRGASAIYVGTPVDGASYCCDVVCSG